MLACLFAFQWAGLHAPHITEYSVLLALLHYSIGVGSRGARGVVSPIDYWFNLEGRSGVKKRLGSLLLPPKPIPSSYANV